MEKPNESFDADREITIFGFVIAATLLSFIALAISILFFEEFI